MWCEVRVGNLLRGGGLLYGWFCNCFVLLRGLGSLFVCSRCVLKSLRWSLSWPRLSLMVTRVSCLGYQVSQSLTSARSR